MVFLCLGTKPYLYISLVFFKFKTCYYLNASCDFVYI